MNITVNLLTNKNTYILSDDLATEYSTNERGYKVIQGEDNATTITVNYPTSYAVFDKQVEMINAKGQQTIIELTGSEFTLPNTMTYAGNTTLVFSAITDDIKVVWQKVIIPITATGIDFENIALANPDILGEAIEASKYYAQFKEDVEAGKFNGTDGIDGLGGNLTILNSDEMELEIGKKYVVEVAGVAENGLVTAKLVEEEEVEIDLSNYVEKEEGKGLSTNDFDNASKTAITSAQSTATNAYTLAQSKKSSYSKTYYDTTFESLLSSLKAMVQLGRNYKGRTFIQLNFTNAFGYKSFVNGTIDFFGYSTGETFYFQLTGPFTNDRLGFLTFYCTLNTSSLTLSLVSDVVYRFSTGAYTSEAYTDMIGYGVNSKVEVIY